MTSSVPGQKGPLTRFGIYRIVREHMEKAGIKGPKLGPHRIRHAFGKTFLAEGGDLRSLQEIMGHTSMKPLEVYLRTVAADDAIEVHRQVRPFSNWKF